jgi:fructosamine-3-kinase
VPWFKCLVEGENFPGYLIGESALVGFYATRFIQANSPNEAELLVLELLKSDKNISIPTATAKLTNAKTSFELIEEIPSHAVGSNSGFTFFIMGT